LRVSLCSVCALNHAKPPQYWRALWRFRDPFFVALLATEFPAVLPLAFQGLRGSFGCDSQLLVFLPPPLLAVPDRPFFTPCDTLDVRKSLGFYFFFFLSHCHDLRPCDIPGSKGKRYLAPFLLLRAERYRPLFLPLLFLSSPLSHRPFLHEGRPTPKPQVFLPPKLGFLSRGFQHLLCRDANRQLFFGVSPYSHEVCPNLFPPSPLASFCCSWFSLPSKLQYASLWAPPSSLRALRPTPIRHIPPLATGTSERRLLR